MIPKDLPRDPPRSPRDRARDLETLIPENRAQSHAKHLVLKPVLAMEREARFNEKSFE